MACSTKIDVEKQDGFGDQLVGMINNGVTSLMVSIGHRSGLFDVMSDGESRTAGQIASAAGLNERYVKEWLGLRVAASRLH
jgi:hypothetical protein